MEWFNLNKYKIIILKDMAHVCYVRAIYDRQQWFAERDFLQPT